MILTDEFAGLCLMYSATHGEEDKFPLTNSKDQEDFIENFDKIENSIYRNFDMDVSAIADDIVTRVDFDNINEDNLWDELLSAMDDSLIYTEDQWSIIKFYCSPSNANFSYAMEEFENELYNIIVSNIITKDDLQDEEDQ